MASISTLAKKFATRVRFERIKRRYSQEKLAELAGIGRSTLTQIEAQTSSPTLDVVEKLANALEYEPYELLIFKNDIICVCRMFFINLHRKSFC